MKELQELRKKLYDQWEMVRELGGEWNAGYEQALRFAISVVYDQIRLLERAQQKPQHHDQPRKKDYVNWEIRKDYK